MFETELLDSELLAPPKDETLWDRVKDIVYRLFYGGSADEYENFSFGNTVVTYRIIIIALLLGLIIASAVMIYKRRVLGRFVRALAEAEAFGAENAKALSELSLGGSRGIVASLKSGTLFRMIGSVKKKEYEEKLKAAILAKDEEKGKKGSSKKMLGEFRPAPLSDKYYLPEDEKKRESVLTLFSEKGSGAWSLVLTVVFCIGAAAVLFYAVPFFISLFDSVL